jgi:hypothetical protein
MSRLIYIPFDHLHRNFGALRAKDVLTGLDKGEI